MIKTTIIVLDILMVISFVLGLMSLNIWHRRQHSVHLFVLSWIMSLGDVLLALSNDDWDALPYFLICFIVTGVFIRKIEKDNLDKIPSN